MIFHDVQVVESQAGASGWADEFHQAAGGAAGVTASGSRWADEFSQRSGLPSQHISPPPLASSSDWADEFARGVADLRLGEGAGEAEAMERAWAEGRDATGWVDEFQGGEEAVYEVGMKDKRMPSCVMMFDTLSRFLC